MATLLRFLRPTLYKLVFVAGRLLLPSGVRLHLVQVTNTTGPWILATFGSAPVIWPTFVLSLLLQLCAPLFFRLYGAKYRRSY